MPAALLTGCSALATLSLHGNSLTVEQLRDTPGWAEFDARRRAKYDKQARALGWRAGPAVRAAVERGSAAGAALAGVGSWPCVRSARSLVHILPPLERRWTCA